MHSYIAKSPQNSFTGGWLESLEWSKARISEKSTELVKVYHVRAGEREARIIAEVSSEGVRPILKGRHVAIRKLKAT